MKRNNTNVRAAQSGIRGHIMVYLMLFVVGMLALVWLFQIVFLDDFYRYSRQRQVESAAGVLISNLDNADVSVLADHLSEQHEVCILVLDEERRRVLSSEDVRSCLIHRMSSHDLQWWCSRTPEDGTPLIELFSVDPLAHSRTVNHRFKGMPRHEDSREQHSLLYAQRITLPDGRPGYLLLNSMITPVDATVSTLRSQLVIITAVTLLGALGLAWLIARRLSQPIIETSAAARQLPQGRYDPPAHSRRYREIAELNATLSNAAQELNQVERLKHELIANISHDLRTPLTMIGGYAEAMRDIPGENTPENMQTIIDETNRLSSLVGEVMAFSRLESGALPMNPSDFSLTGAVREITARISHLVGSDGYEVRFDPGEELMVTADEARISQVVYNLIGNALTYTGDDRRVEVTQTRRGDLVRISIRDTGKGIPPEELPLIWNRYYRTAESHRRAVIGTGLGLSIVRSILEQHAAPYGVDSAPGEGSTFWFELPPAK